MRRHQINACFLPLVNQVDDEGLSFVIWAFMWFVFWSQDKRADISWDQDRQKHCVIDGQVDSRGTSEVSASTPMNAWLKRSYDIRWGPLQKKADEGGRNVLLTVRRVIQRSCVWRMACGLHGLMESRLACCFTLKKRPLVYCCRQGPINTNGISSRDIPLEWSQYSCKTAEKTIRYFLSNTSIFSYEGNFYVFEK